MYAGSMVEQATAEEIFEDPKHPYTQGLWGAIPLIDREKETLAVIPGIVPDLSQPPEGCKFHPRCPFRFETCDRMIPPLLETSQRHLVSCYLYGGSKDR
jgi:peptide/nickel transport system ATP-binding protein